MYRFIINTPGPLHPFLMPTPSNLMYLLALPDDCIVMCEDVLTAMDNIHVYEDKTATSGQRFYVEVDDFGSWETDVEDGVVHVMDIIQLPSPAPFIPSNIAVPLLNIKRMPDAFPDVLYRVESIHGWYAHVAPYELTSDDVSCWHHSGVEKLFTITKLQRENY